MVSGMDGVAGVCVRNYVEQELWFESGTVFLTHRTVQLRLERRAVARQVTRNSATQQCAPKVSQTSLYTVCFSLKSSNTATLIKLFRRAMYIHSSITVFWRMHIFKFTALICNGFIKNYFNMLV